MLFWWIMYSEKNFDNCYEIRVIKMIKDGGLSFETL